MLMLLLCGSIGTWGQDSFNPSDPPEPGQPPMKLQVTVSPAEAGSVSGTGLYVAGATVSLRAYVNTGFRFIGWTDANGNTLSTSTNFSYRKGEGHERLWANYVFDPDAPADPADPYTIMYFQLQLNATEGGTVSGGGRYLAGSRVTVNASVNNQFDFVGWYDDATGDLLSTSSRFTYTTTDRHRALTARFQFNPDNPTEPDTPVLSRRVTVTATEGGTVSISQQRPLIGSSVTLTANKNTGYDFVGWYRNGELYTKLSRFSYTVTDAYDQNFEARFEFNPDSPNDPGMPTTTKHAFFLMNKVTKPGTTVQYPIYLSSVKTLNDMTFQLTFPQELPPDLGSVSMSARAQGYTVSATQQNDTTYVISFIGGKVPAGNAAVIVLSVPVPSDIITGKGYPIKINQVTVTEEDAAVTTASTRNGRISVYKNGDSNGDDVVNVIDVTNTISTILGEPPSVFISEAADTNDHDGINVVDVTNIIDIILNGSGSTQGSTAEPVADPQ